MAVKIQPAEIQNLQEIEAVVAGPDGADRLLIIDGQFDSRLEVTAKTAEEAIAKETFSVLVGPVLTRKQFFRASAGASIANVFLFTPERGAMHRHEILGVDAGWDDESGQVELRIEAEVAASFRANASTYIRAFAFHVTILAAAAAA